jgi:hypothetical protein
MPTLLESLSVDQAVASSLCGFDPGGASPAAGGELELERLCERECSQVLAAAADLKTSLRTRIMTMLISIPETDVFEQGGGVGRVSPSPSLATLSGWVEKPISVPMPPASTWAKPRPKYEDRVPPFDPASWPTDCRGYIQEHQVGLGL